MHSGFTGFKGFSGFNGFTGFNGFSGIGEGVIIPDGALQYYSFTQNNFDHAIDEQVDGINIVSTTRAEDLSVIQTNTGQVLTFGANTASFDRGVGMVVPPEATNLISFSTPSTPGWSETRTTLQQGAVLSPDGLLGGALLTDSVDANNHNTSTPSIGITAFGQYVVTFHAKKFNQSNIIFRVDLSVNATNNRIQANLNFDTGVIVATTGAIGVVTCIPLVDGWFEVTISGAHATGSQINTSYFTWIDDSLPGNPIYTGTGSDGSYVWATQLETGDNATPIIYRPGAPETRDATDTAISTFFDLGLTSPWPSSNFSVEISGIDVPDLTPDAAIFWSTNIQLYLDATGANLLATLGGDTASIAVSTVADIASAALEFEAGQLYAVSNGVRGTGVASVGSSWVNELFTFSDGAGSRFFEGTPLLAELTLKPLP